MIPSTCSMMKAARRNDRLVDMTFARSLDEPEMEFIHAIRPTETEIIEKMKADPTFSGFDPELYNSKRVLYAAPFKDERTLSVYHDYDGNSYADPEGIMRGFMFRWPKADINMADNEGDVRAIMDRMMTGVPLNKKGELRGDELLLRLKPEDLEGFGKMLRPFAYDTKNRKFITGGPFLKSTLDDFDPTVEKPDPEQERLNTRRKDLEDYLKGAKWYITDKVSMRSFPTHLPLEEQNKWIDDAWKQIKDLKMDAWKRMWEEGKADRPPPGYKHNNRFL